MAGFVFLTCSNPDHMYKVGECTQGQCNTVCINIDLFSEYTNTGCLKGKVLFVIHIKKY